MDTREYAKDADVTPPANPSTPSTGYPTDGNPSLGDPSTTPGAYWFYQIAEELRNIVVEAGNTPDSADLSQLAQAIAVLSIKPVANFDEIKTDTTLRIGQRVMALGNQSPGDGGGNLFEIVAAGTGTEDGGSYINLTGITGQAKGLFPDGVYFKQFGATGLGIADDQPAIQACIDYMASVGGGVVNSGEGVFALANTVNNPYANVKINCSGGDRTHDLGGQGTLARTEFKWIGVSGGLMFHVYSPAGASNQKMVGCGLKDAYFNANGLAGGGLLITSQNAGEYERIHFHEFSGHCLKVTTHVLGEASDSQHNRFKNITCRQYVETGSFIELDGGSSSDNASMNSFYDCSGAVKDGDGIVLRNCDNNLFFRSRIFMAPGATGNAIVAHGSNSSQLETARANTFFAFSTNALGTIIAKGTTSYTYPSVDNKIIEADVGNGTPLPTVEAGASFWFESHRNMQYESGLVNAVIGGSAAQIDTLRANQGTESLRLKNGASNHLTLESGDALSEWGVSIDEATGDLRFIRNAGSGHMILPQPLDITGQTLTTSATAGAASALPATPENYFNIEVNGTVYKVPLYNV